MAYMDKITVVLYVGACLFSLFHGKPMAAVKIVPDGPGDYGLPQ